jgi:hypothetical protein
MINFCGYIKIKDYESHNCKQRPTGSNHCGLIGKLAGKGLCCRLLAIFGLVELIKNRNMSKRNKFLRKIVTVLVKIRGTYTTKIN